MTGTSMDGIDISYCFTDGLNILNIINEKSYSYSLADHKNIKDYNFKKIKDNKLIYKLDLQITDVYIKYLKKFFKEYKINKNNIDFISLSGQTILHIPSKKLTLQIGNPKIISQYFKLDVVSDFRIKDIINGGQGAPIGAYYHKLLIKKMNLKSAIINLGGVANFSLINNIKFISSDIGPANAILDDLVLYFYNKKYDKDGKIAAKGNINNKIFNLYKKDIFFKKKFPKSLDRNYFHYLMKKLKKINPHDSINTSLNFTIYSIINLTENKIFSNINEIIFTGGGRRNKYLLEKLKKLKNNLKISIIDDYGLDGDLIESQMFSYIGVRCIKKLIISSPNTSGVKKRLSGGKVYKFNA